MIKLLSISPDDSHGMSPLSQYSFLDRDGVSPALRKMHPQNQFIINIFHSLGMIIILLKYHFIFLSFL